MFKRKNDFEDDAPLPRWLYVVAPLLILLIGGIGVLIGLEINNRAREDYWAAYREAMQRGTETAAQTATAQKLMLDLTMTMDDGLFWEQTQAASSTATATQTAVNATATSLAQTLVAQTTLVTGVPDAWMPPEPTCSEMRCLDVLFLFDTTGSMSDEIAQLQNNILVIAGEVAALDADVRYGLVAYRDRGDDYTTQVYEFTPDVAQFQASLNTLEAYGGGDTPEHLSRGLHEALHTVRWRETNTVKLIFLIGDAAPQFYGDYSYADEMQFALQKGIKIHTLASSGLDPQGEYVFRQIAQVTMGRFIFLTYDTQATAVTGAPSGDYRPDLNVGIPDGTQAAGNYTVEQLDDIILRLILDELLIETAQATATPTPMSADAATTAAEMACDVVRRAPPENAPTRIPFNGTPDANPHYIDPYVAVCVTKPVAKVGDTVRIFAQAISIGMPKYTLTQTDATGEPITEDIPTLILTGTAETEWKMEYIFTAAQPGTVYFSIYAGGEIHYGYPGPATWGGGNSELIQIQVIGESGVDSGIDLANVNFDNLPCTPVDIEPSEDRRAWGNARFAICATSTTVHIGEQIAFVAAPINVERNYPDQCVTTELVQNLPLFHVKTQLLDCTGAAIYVLEATQTGSSDVYFFSPQVIMYPPEISLNGTDDVYSASLNITVTE